jgi:serine transporter
MSLFGTAIGAGILFLPIAIGTNGVLSLLIMALLAYPLTHYSHKLLAKFIYSSEGLDDITKVSDNTFGSKIGFMVTISYFLEIFIVLLLYTVALVNTCDLILSSNFGINESNRVLISFVVVSFLMFIISMGLDIVLKIISYLVFLFIFTIFVLSIYMMQFYNGGIFNDFNLGSVDLSQIFKSFIYVIPIMIFAFNHVAIISSMVINQKKEQKKIASKNIDKILRNSHILMDFVVLFFLFSCSFVFNVSELNEANSKI